MKTQPSKNRQCLRLRTNKDQWLTGEVAAIEVLATERITLGISLCSAQAVSMDAH